MAPALQKIDSADVRSWPNSEVPERPAADFRFLGYFGLVVLATSLSRV